jgi:hypothetical protein
MAGSARETLLWAPDHQVTLCFPGRGSSPSPRDDGASCGVYRGVYRMTRVSIAPSRARIRVRLKGPSWLNEQQRQATRLDEPRIRGRTVVRRSRDTTGPPRSGVRSLAVATAGGDPRWPTYLGVYLPRGWAPNGEAWIWTVVSCGAYASKVTAAPGAWPSQPAECRLRRRVPTLTLGPSFFCFRRT